MTIQIFFLNPSFAKLMRLIVAWFYFRMHKISEGLFSKCGLWVISNIGNYSDFSCLTIVDVQISNYKKSYLGRRIFDAGVGSADGTPIKSPLGLPVSGANPLAGLAGLPPLFSPTGGLPPALPNMEMLMMMWGRVCSVCQKVTMEICFRNFRSS